MIKAFFFNQRMWLWPILAFLVVTPLTPFLDLAIERFFYEGNGKFSADLLYTFVFDYGVIPGQLICALALIIFFGSYIFKKLKAWRHISLIMVAALVIGSGLITHAIFKDHWGRPRPKQVVEFGGEQAFRPYYQPNFFHQPQPSKSFPCGHCTMGFYFFAAALIALRSGHRAMFWGWLVFALGLGGLLSLARMAQGGHFFSDTLAGMLVMWLTAWVLVQWIPSKNQALR